MSNSRIFFEIFGRPFFRRLVLPLGLLLFAVSQADATVKWAAIREHLATREPWQIALVITVLFLSWGTTAGRALRTVWRQPVIAYLVRQPMTRAQWAQYLAPSLFIAFVPVAGICWLAPRYANSVVHYAGFVGLAWPIILGASYSGRSAARWIAIGTSALAALIFGYAYQPAVAYLALLVTVFLIPLSVCAIPDQVAGPGQVNSGHLAASRPAFSIVRRDLLYLWRMQKHSLSGLAWLGIFAALAMFALRVNGHVLGRDAFEYACGLLAIAMLPAYEILERTKKGLGPEFMRRRWPINHVDRGVALVCLMFALIGPSMIAMAALGSTMGVEYLPLFMVYATTSVVCIAALFSLLLVDPGASFGWGMFILLVHATLAIGLSPWVYGIFAAITIPVAFALIVRGLRKFTRRMETGSLEQSA